MRVLVFLGLLGVLPLVDVVSPGADRQVVLLETFDQYSPASFPEQWKVRGDEDEAREIYRVTEENGNRFLHAHADRQAIQIGLVQKFRPQEFPVLRWRWRAIQLPPGADERRKETHDSVAGVYVIFEGRIFPRIIKYVWSSTLPVGTRIQNPLYWRAKMVVLQSGSSGVGEWHQETVNFYQDYKELFGREPEEVQGIGLMTSSSYTKSVALADYDDFFLVSAEASSADRSTLLSPRELSLACLRVSAPSTPV